MNSLGVASRLDVDTAEGNPGAEAPRPRADPFPFAHNVALHTRLTRRWLALWGLLLAGMTIAGKGFAYIGLPPLFITEVTLLLGLGVFLLQPCWKQALSQPVVLLILALFGWCTFRTLPYLGEYGMDAPRDLVIAGYGALAICVAAALMSHPDRIGWALGRYQVHAKVFLCVMPFVWVVGQALGSAMPSWPWAPGVGVIDLKPGDQPVHLGAIAVLMLLGLFRGRSVGWTLLLCVMLGMTGAVSRGGLVAFGVAFAVGFFARPVNRWASRLLIVCIVVLTAALLTDVSVEVPGREREYSARQIMLNLYTIVGDDPTGDLDDTKQWRLDWWNKIIDYTVYGDYFWTGKGFGVNLANSDGFQVWEDDSLRSPHNGHLTFLARGGVPAFALWVAIQLTWLASMVNGYVVARQKKDTNWACLFVFLIAYYTSLVFNASFDVYLEGPMGGSWYWSVIGVGVAAAWVFKHRPEALHVPAATPREETV